MKENGFTLVKARSRRYPTRTITDANYADDIVVLAKMSESMCFNQRGHVSTLNGRFLKLVDKFSFHGSMVSSTENGIDT